MNDIRFALRQLRKSPGFTLVAVVTLALGIGLNTAIFSLINELFLRGLPFKDPSRVVHLYGGDKSRDLDRKSTRLNSSHGYISYAVFCLKKKKTIKQTTCDT